MNSVILYLLLVIEYYCKMVATEGQVRRSLQRFASFERKVTFDGTEKVKLERVEKDEFTLPLSDQVAHYDSEKLANFWNSENKQYFEIPSLPSRICQGLKEGLLNRTAIIIFTYLAAYYLANCIIIEYWCTEELLNQAFINSIEQKMGLEGIARMNITEHAMCLHYKVQIRKLADKEALFSKILTLLLGFYVAFTIERWWRQVSLLPRIDSICLTLEGCVWCDPRKKEIDILVPEEGINVIQFKQTVARYCLLSFTMCMSMISQPLRKKFRKPQNFNQALLLSFEEYNVLKSKYGGDGWKTKWTVPLLWANSMICRASAEPKDDLKFKYTREIIRELKIFQRNLRDLSDFNTYHVPNLVIRGITLGIWFWFCMGIFASEGLLTSLGHDISLPSALVLNFPLMHCIQYIMLFQWLHTATFLQNPFGKDK